MTGYSYNLYHWQPLVVTSTTVIPLAKPTIWMPVVIHKIDGASDTPKGTAFFSINKDLPDASWIPLVFDANGVSVLTYPAYALKVVPSATGKIEVLI